MARKYINPNRQADERAAVLAAAMPWKSQRELAEFAAREPSRAELRAMAAGTRPRAAAAGGKPVRVTIAPTDHGGHELIAPWGIAWQNADGTTSSLTPGQARQAEGISPAAAALDQFPWARSWGSFLAAVRDPQGLARQQITNAVGEFGERVPSEGGFLVPERLLDELQVYIADAIIRPRATQVPMSTLRVDVPALDSYDSAGGAQVLGGMEFALVNEGEAYPATQPAFGRVVLEGRKFGSYLVDVPNELLADASPLTDVFLPRVIAEGLAWYEDDLFISQGTGAGQPQSLVNAPAAIGVNRATANEVNVADLANMMRALHPASERGAATWIVADQVFSQLMELSLGVGTSPAPGYVPASEWLRWDDTHGCWRLLGLEVVPHDHLPSLGSTGDVILADLRQYLVGTLSEMEVDISSQGSGFGTDTSNIRVRTRIDARFWPQQSFTTAAGAVVSPLVILNAAT